MVVAILYSLFFLPVLMSMHVSLHTHVCMHMIVQTGRDKGEEINTALIYFSSVSLMSPQKSSRDTANGENE